MTTRRDDDLDTGTFDLSVFQADERTAAGASRQAQLVCLVGHEAGRVWPIGARPLVIGRGAEADVRLVADDVSRRHAAIGCLSGAHVIEDLGSRNGISVNGAPVTRHALQLGDRLQIAGSTLLVYAAQDELERRALRLQKLDSLAQLAGGVVHDLKNTLAVVLANAEFLRDWAVRAGVEDPDLRASIDDILAAVEGGSELTGRLLAFGRRDPGAAISMVRIAELATEVARLAERTGGADRPISVDVDVDPALVVSGHRSDLHHALVNLALNARDAMPSGGAVTIRARAVQLGGGAALGLHLPAPGRYVELAVIDTGVGMDEATRARAFEPFFTTKPAGQGTGLGLSGVEAVVRAHGGGVRVESTRGSGTTVRLYLPDASPGADRAAGS